MSFNSVVYIQFTVFIYNSVRKVNNFLYKQTQGNIIQGTLVGVGSV